MEDIHGLAICSGVGGLELGLHLALGESYRTVCHIEREAFAAATLVARMEEKAMDKAPIWDDIATFDGGAWRGRINLISAGYPCQPFSFCGMARGTKDKRHLWPHVARIISEVEPQRVFLENVAGHVVLGLNTVLGELTNIGYDAVWSTFSACEVGAPHMRQRLFVMADSRRIFRSRVCNSSNGSIIGKEKKRHGKTPVGKSNRLISALGLTDSVRGHWTSESCVGRTAPDGLADRLDRIRACGNGVVPVVAAYAFRTLTEALCVNE